MALRPAHLQEPSAPARRRTRTPSSRSAGGRAAPSVRGVPAAEDGAGRPGAADGPRSGATSSTVRVLVAATARLTRRGLLALLVSLAVYLTMEVQVFERTYPDAASRATVAQFGQDPAFRILTGMPAGDSIGALVVWDAGWMLQLVVGVWVVVTTSRLLRGDEDLDRVSFLLAGPVRARTLLAAQVGTLLAACALVGVVVGGTLALNGTDVVGATAFGLQVAAYAATFVTVTALCAQLFGRRGRVAGTAAVVLGAAVLLRMVANSADDRAWVAWTTPLGWGDRLRAYGDEQWAVLVVPVVVVSVLLGAALALREERDTGDAVLRSGRADRSRLLWLGSPVAFAWRSALPSLLGWVAGLAATGAVIGAMLPSVEELVAQDESYRAILESFGIDLTDVVLGFVSMMGTIIGMVVALQVTWRIGAARAEEDAGRLEQLLARPLPRHRWLLGHVALAVGGAVLLVAVTGAALWGAAAAVGSQVGFADVAAASVNALPAIAVFLGLAVLLLGVAPRLVVPVGASLAMVAYVVELVGPALDWPEWVLALSPFHHLAMVPVEDVAVGPAVVLVVVGAVLTAVGVTAFGRRDLVGA